MITTNVMGKCIHDGCLLTLLLLLLLLLYFWVRSFPFHFFLFLDWIDIIMLLFLLSPIFLSFALFLSYCMHIFVCVLLLQFGEFEHLLTRIITIIILRWNAISTHHHCKSKKSKICHFFSQLFRVFCFFPLWI